MKIAIRYKDNDFWSTYTAVMEVIHAAYIYRPDEFPLNKTDLVRMINNLTYGCYLTRQLRYDLPGKNAVPTPKDWDKRYQRTKDWMMVNITEDRVFINEEVDAYLDEYDRGDNSETIILDTDLDHDNNEPIYLR